LVDGGNVISGNFEQGILIDDVNSENNTITENNIGTDPLGVYRISNGTGIELYQSTNNLIDRNTISGNTGFGVLLSKASKNSIIGNRIGTNFISDRAIPNHSGVGLFKKSTLNSIKDNVISGNDYDGLVISDSGTKLNKVFGNRIGLNYGRHNAIPNKKNGILITEGASYNIVGSESYPNTISGNLNAGLLILKSNYNQVINNEFGIGFQSIIPNRFGIHLYISNFNIIGGESLNYGNTISGNKEDGIRMERSKSNSIQFNLIGTELGFTKALPNSNNGINIDFGEYNIIGPENIISGNLDAGVVLYRSSNNQIYGNHIGTNKEGFPIPNKYGTCLLGNSKNNRIVNNQIWYNCSGVKESAMKGIVNWYENNFIKNSSCPNSGIHLNNSNSKITGNTITADEGNAISCNNASLPLITKNNIFNNKGYGLVNQDATVTVKAKGNWWGDPSGPGGKGPGLGDEVSDYVDYGNWHSDPASIVVGLGPDTVYAAIGQEDSVYCFFQNWANLNDILNVNIKADSSGWITDNSAFTVTCADSLGASSVIHFAVPVSVQPGATNKVSLTTVSQSDTSLISVDSFIIVVYPSHLTRIEISPDTAFVQTGQGHLFFVEGLDSLGRPHQTQLRWTSSCGTIDSSGYFTAGSEAGTCTVTAEDTLTNILATAIVHIFTPAAQIEISPDTAVVRQNSTQSFVLNAYDSASATTLAFPRWTATGGTITSDGLYTAGDTLGYYFVVAEDSLSGLIDTAIVHVTMGTSTDPDTKTNVQTDVKLEQNHPNPFHSFTNILYSLPQRAYITLKVYDLLGNLMAILEDGEQERGTHKVEYRADELPDGIYFYHLRSATHSMAKKMVISK
jgi:parallel beta-helix repeat protein